MASSSDTFMASSSDQDQKINVAAPSDQPAAKADKGKGNPNKANNNKNKKSGPAAAAAPPLGPLPAFIDERIKIWDEYKTKHEEWISKLGDTPIKITLPDGKAVDGIAWKTTPYDIAKNISRNLAKEVIVAKVNDKYHDLHRPIEGDGTLQLFKFDTPEGKHCFWHSSAHVLGQAMEKKYAAHLTVGPALEEGFYYDADIPDHPTSDAAPGDSAAERVAISSDDLSDLNNIAVEIVKEKQPFERLAVPRDVALQMFAYNRFKQEIIGKIPAEEQVSLYRCGPLIDLCRGPHLPNTSFIKGYRVTKTSGVYWLAKQDNPLLQRVYGISFPEEKQLAEWEKFQQEAALRDHRNVGKAQGLFFFHPYSPGSAFMLPHGARIYNRLMNFVKGEYHRRGFTEVISPNMFNKALWETSGHWQNYKENMFVFNCDATEFSLKPMNCPGHCLMFDHTARSYRELPIRFADFGVLHRNELAGALTGLTRVRRFQQDDAHIFCAPEMIQGEIKNCLEFMQYVYGIFGYEFALELSTRPEEKFLGDIETWNKAEGMIAEALNAFGKPWKLNPGDGAFYGP
jgi:threonyl-tRNA synthetase